MPQALLERILVLVEDSLEMRAADGSGGAARTFMARLAGRARVERRRKRTLIAARPWRTPRRRAGQWLTEIDVLTALERAWLAATLAAVLFCGALALAAIWDRAIFLEALHEALTRNPEWPQPPDEIPGDAAAGRGQQGDR
jgi:hypothetical protein